MLPVLIRRQCIYDGSSAYWYPNASTIQEQCPNGTQVVSETVGMIANQVIKSIICIYDLSFLVACIDYIYIYIWLSVFVDFSP